MKRAIKYGNSLCVTLSSHVRHFRGFVEAKTVGRADRRAGRFEAGVNALHTVVAFDHLSCFGIPLGCSPGAGGHATLAAHAQRRVHEDNAVFCPFLHEDIQKMNVSFVPDILRKLSEVHVIQNGGNGKVASVLLRGGSASHTLVLIDGIRMNTTTTGSFDFSGISIDDIERIDIVKGPLSTIYGSDAMAGVISIITKKGTGRFKSDVSLEAGSKGTVNTTAGISGGYKTIDYRLTGKYFQTDGISAADAGTEPDGYRKALLSGKLGFSPSENLVVEFTGSYAYDRSELDGFDFFSSKAFSQRLQDCDTGREGRRTISQYIRPGMGVVAGGGTDRVAVPGPCHPLIFRASQRMFPRFLDTPLCEQCPWIRNRY